MKNLGRATYIKGKLYFDEVGWSLVKRVAKRWHKSAKYVVMSAVKRYIKGGVYGENKKSI